MTSFVKQVRELAQKNYSRGGDTIVECFSDEEILEEFKTLSDVKEYCGLRIEAALNARWGGDDDPELERSKSFEEEWDE